MSLHYVLDGYNIVKQLPPLKLKNLRAGREGLLSFVETYRPQGSSSNKVTVVFDGSDDVVSYAQTYPYEVIFACGESADDRIRRLVQKSKHPQTMIIVTDDRELKFFIRSLGAQVMSVADFASKAKRAQPVLSSEKEEKRISYSTQARITKEMRKLWLKDE